MTTKRLLAQALKNKMVDKLKSSKIVKPSDIKKLQFTPMVASRVKKLGDNFEERGGIHIPYFTLKGKVDKSMFRVRYLEDPPDRFTKDKVAKYMQPANVPPTLYLPPIFDWDKIAKDPSAPILITEGEFKAACACLHDYPTIGIGGVYAWKSAKRLLPMLPDFKQFTWKGNFTRDGMVGEYGREVILVFDADLKTNPMVQQALKEFCDELLVLGAEPKMVFIEEIPEAPKTGLDDLLYHRGDEAFIKLLDEAKMYSMAGNLMALNAEVAYLHEVGVVMKMDNGQIIKPSDFTTHAYSNRHYYEEVWSEVKGNYRVQKKPAATAWLKWEHRNELKNIVFRPSQPRITDDGNFNMWKGWGCKPIKGDVKPWKDLMSYVFSGDTKAQQWFERWCAIQFQQPGKKLFSAVLMWSVDQGTGKSFIGQILASIFGSDNSAEAGQQNIKNQYNMWRVTKQFVLGDEITGSNSRKDADFLKALVTMNRVLVDEKFKPAYMMDDITNYYFTSNHPDALFLEDTDRRFFVWEIASMPRPREFYKKIEEWLNNGGKEALFYYFLEMDLGKFSATDHAYVTDAKKEMIYTAKSEIGEWVDQLKDIPDQVLRIGGVAVTGDLFTTQRLVDIYKYNVGNSTLTPNGMARHLKTSKFARAHNGGYVRIGGEAHRIFIVRNQEKWVNASLKDIKEHFLYHNKKFKK